MHKYFLFSCTVLVIWSLTFRSMIHFKLIFVYGIYGICNGQGFCAPHTHTHTHPCSWSRPFVENTLLKLQWHNRLARGTYMAVRAKILSFPCWINLVPLWKRVNHINMGLFLTSVLFHWSICLFLHQYHNVLIFTVLSKCWNQKV